MDKVQIKDVATIVNGSTPSTKKPEYWDGDIPWITPKDLSSNHMRFVSKGERNITDEGYKSCSTTLLPKGTVLLTSRAPIGYLAIADCPMCTNQGFKSLICNQDKILPLYMYYWLSTRVDYLKGISTGATFKELSKSTLENVEMKLPTNEEQQHIVGVRRNEYEA
jgi:type I restriction enzyme S subunit